MDKLSEKIPLILSVFLFTLCLSGCQNANKPEPLNLAVPTMTETLVKTPTQTATRGLAPTITPFPTSSPTITRTAFPTLTPTATPSPAPYRPAELFHYEDANGRQVDWAYAHITRIGKNQFGEVNDLWAFLSFQLLDRGIHQRNFNFLGETVTVYYLNVAHQFNGELLPMQLVLGGTPGKNMAIDDIPAGGTTYVQVQVRDTSDAPFNPYITHRDANRAYDLREESYPLMLLKDFQSLLPTLPDDIILLADHPILFPRNNWPQIKLDMQRISYLAARYQPFFELDAYDRLADQSDFAYALRDHLLANEPVPKSIYAYSSQTLIIILDRE